MLLADTASVDVQRTGDLEFVVTASTGDATVSDATASDAIASDTTVGLRLVGPSAADVHGDRVVVGPVSMHFNTPPASIVDRSSDESTELHVTWLAPQASVDITIANHPAADQSDTGH